MHQYVTKSLVQVVNENLRLLDLVGDNVIRILERVWRNSHPIVEADFLE